MSCNDAVSIPLVANWEGSDLALMARVEGNDGDNITQADVSSIALSVYNRLTQELIGTETPVVGDSIYNTLQTGSGWDQDSTGFNFRHVIDGDLFPDGGMTYRVEVLATPPSGNAFPLAVIDVESRELFSV